MSIAGAYIYHSIAPSNSALCACKNYYFCESPGGSFTMKLLKDCWITLLEVFNAISGIQTDGTQQSLGVGRWRPGHGKTPHYPFPPKKPAPAPVQPTPAPIFSPPSHGQTPDSSIVCNYSAMGPGWSSCSTPLDRGCWLKGPNNETFDIETDYEVKKPKGVTRKVC